MILFNEILIAINEEISDKENHTEETITTEALSLRLPGRILHLTPLLKAKKFRTQKKPGALSAWENLQKAELGKLHMSDAKNGAGRYTFTINHQCL